MNIRLKAFFSPTITPLDEKERVDELGFINQLNRLIDNGDSRHLSIGNFWRIYHVDGHGARTGDGHRRQSNRRPVCRLSVG